jgi:anti-sigma factor RsiW
MRCAEVQINLGAFVMGGLETEEDAEIRRHLASCSSCRDELQEIEKIN